MTRKILGFTMIFAFLYMLCYLFTGSFIEASKGFLFAFGGASLIFGGIYLISEN